MLSDNTEADNRCAATAAAAAAGSITKDGPIDTGFFQRISGQITLLPRRCPIGLKSGTVVVVVDDEYTYLHRSNLNLMDYILLLGRGPVKEDASSTTIDVCFTASGTRRSKKKRECRALPVDNELVPV